MWSQPERLGADRLGCEALQRADHRAFRLAGQPEVAQAVGVLLPQVVLARMTIASVCQFGSIARMLTRCQPGRPNFFLGQARSVVKVGVADAGKP